MVDLLGDHAANDAQLVGNRSLMRQIIADPLSAVPVLLELGQVPLDLQLLTLQLRDGLACGERIGHRLTIQAIELRLVVEGFQLRRTTQTCTRRSLA